MNLWVRTKSKLGLYKIDNLHCYCGDITTYIYNIPYKLGSYSPERAIEILNEIQNIINAKTIIKFKEFVPTEHLKRVKDAIDKNSIIELPNYEIKELAGVIVYEMPKE